MKHREGEDVIYTSEGVGRICRIASVDESDEHLPYMLVVPGSGHQWVRAQDVKPLDDTPVVNQDGDPLTPSDLAKRVRNGLRDGDVTLKDLADLSALLVAQLDGDDKPEPLVASGLCSSCMGEVTFDTTNGTWTHADSAGHQPPAIIPGA